MGRTTAQPETPAQDPTDQRAAIEFLQQGAGLGPQAERIDTHGALVFLIGDTALKIKRAVTYDYMDLSTLEKRRALIEREFELNHATAPSIYRGVVPVVRKPDGTLALGGAGEVIEWVLSMNRFAPEAELSQIAKTHGIDTHLAEKLGESIARYHRAAPVSDLDGALLMTEILDELDRVFATMKDAFEGATGPFIAQCRAICRQRAPDLRARSRGRHIRRCHGDLHLRNIVMIDDVPTPFDALEFDERLGTCDTLYDLAFLLMDLDHLGMTGAANGVLNAYLTTAAPGDLGDSGLSLLPLYMAVRAAIRAMVAVQTAALSDTSDAAIKDARAYLARARTYLNPAKPVLIALGGLSGTGKTTIARALADRIGAAPGAVILRSDVMRKTLLHRDPLEPLGSAGYLPQVTSLTYDAIRRGAAQVLRQGHSAILDAVHGDPQTRLAAEEVARAAGCAFAGFWLETSMETRLNRVASRGPDASDATAEVVRHQDTTDPGPIRWHRIDAEQPTEAIVRAVISGVDAAVNAETGTGGGGDVG